MRKKGVTIKLTYLFIGLLVQIVIIIERATRVPEYLALLKLNSLRNWIALTIAIAINVIAWPLSIVMEIWNVINGI